VHISTGDAGCENFARRAIAERLVFAFLVVELHPGVDAEPGLCNGAVSLYENVLVFQAAPKTLDEDVVQKSTFAIHADRNAGFHQ